MRSPKPPAIYILASKRNGTLYTGVTSDLVKRVWQHKNGADEGFTQKYSVHMLVYYELAVEMGAAISREKQIKGGSRARKLALIESRILAGVIYMTTFWVRQMPMKRFRMAVKDGLTLEVRCSGLLRLCLAMTVVRAWA